MTVAELIEKLKLMPQELPVTAMVEGEGGFYLDYLESVHVDESMYTGKFDPITQKGVYERAVCIT